MTSRGRGVQLKQGIASAAGIQFRYCFDPALPGNSIMGLQSLLHKHAHVSLPCHSTAQFLQRRPVARRTLSHTSSQQRAWRQLVDHRRAFCHMSNRRQHYTAITTCAAATGELHYSAKQSTVHTAMASGRSETGNPRYDSVLICSCRAAGASAHQAH